MTLYYSKTKTTNTLHNTTRHDNYNYTTLRLQYTRLHYTIPRYSTQHYSTLQYTTIHYTTYTTQLQLQLHYTNYTTLQLQPTTTTLLHYNYNYTYNYNCTTPHYIQQLWWGDHCNHCNYSKTHNSNHLSVHQWIRSAICESQQPTLPIVFLFLKLPPRPCAVLLVYMVPSSVSPPPPSPPPHGLGPQVAAPIPFYLQAIGSISEVQLRIC